MAASNVHVKVGCVLFAFSMCFFLIIYFLHICLFACLCIFTYSIHVKIRIFLNYWSLKSTQCLIYLIVCLIKNSGLVSYYTFCRFFTMLLLSMSFGVVMLRGVSLICCQEIICFRKPYKFLVSTSYSIGYCSRCLV